MDAGGLEAGVRSENPADDVVGELGARDKFLFDLNGYIVLRSVVPPALVQAANAAIDAQWDAEYTDGGGERHPCRTQGGGSAIGVGTYAKMQGGLEWDQPHCLPWRELLVNPGCVP